MKTIIELYDEEPIFNILAAVAFRPETLVFIGGKLMHKERKDRIIRCLEERGLPIQIHFYTADANRIPSMLATMERVVDKFSECVVDITGGSSTMLYAAGVFCSSRNIPVMVYEKTRGRFLNLQHCPEAENTPYSLHFSAEDFLIMAGGSFPRCGHVGAKNITPEMEQYIKDVWKIYVEHYDSWTKHVQYLQAVSGGDESKDLSVRAPMEIRMADGKHRYCNKEIFLALRKCGVIEDLLFRGKRVSFRYRSRLLRSCLCDIGIWLELYLYVTAKDSGYFDDVQVSVVIDWDGETEQRSGTINELDILLTKGPTPVFISCKTGVPNTQALNELDVLSERYGGYWAKGVLATMSRLSHVNPSVYRRAADMGIYVLQQEDITQEGLAEKLLRIAQSR